MRRVFGSPSRAIRPVLESALTLAGLLIVVVAVLLTSPFDTSVERFVAIGLGLLALFAIWSLAFNLQVGRATVLLRAADEGEVVFGPREPYLFWLRTGYAIAADGKEVGVASLPLFGKPKLLSTAPLDTVSATIRTGRAGTAVLRLKARDGTWNLRGNKAAVHALARRLRG